MLGSTQPAGTPAVQDVRRMPRTIGGTGTTPVAYMTLTSNATLTFGATPTFSFTFPAGAAVLGTVSYVALYDPTATPQTGWNTIAGPGTVSGNTITFPASSTSLQLKSGVSYDLVLCSVLSALPTPSPVPTVTPSPTAAPSATPSPAPTATPSPSPPPPTPSIGTAFGVNPSGDIAAIPPVGRDSSGNGGYSAVLGYPPSDANHVIVNATAYAVQDSAPLGTGIVYELTLTPSNQAGSTAPVTFRTDASTISLDSSLLDLTKFYTMTVSGGNSTATPPPPRKPRMGFPGTFLDFASPFQAMTVANGATITVQIWQQ
ncbi:MAG TPA: hypothetical protein VIW78_00530 [Burkholderiales bacterium]